MSEDRKRAAPPTTPTTPTSKAIPEVTTQRDTVEIKEERETAPATKKYVCVFHNIIPIEERLCSIGIISH